MKNWWKGIPVLLVLTLASPAGGQSTRDEWLIVRMGSGEVLGKAEWRLERLTLRLSGLNPGQEYQLEVTDPNGSPLARQTFVTLAGGAARVTVETTGVERPPEYSVQIWEMSGANPSTIVAKGQRWRR
jgi:hypothetical protein